MVPVYTNDEPALPGWVTTVQPVKSPVSKSPFWTEAATAADGAINTANAETTSTASKDRTRRITSPRIVDTLRYSSINQNGTRDQQLAQIARAAPSNTRLGRGNCAACCERGHRHLKPSRRMIQPSAVRHHAEHSLVAVTSLPVVRPVPRPSAAARPPSALRRPPHRRSRRSTHRASGPLRHPRPRTRHVQMLWQCTSENSTVRSTSTFGCCVMRTG